MPDEAIETRIRQEEQVITSLRAELDEMAQEIKQQAKAQLPGVYERWMTRVRDENAAKVEQLTDGRVSEIKQHIREFVDSVPKMVDEALARFPHQMELAEDPDTWNEPIFRPLNTLHTRFHELLVRYGLSSKERAADSTSPRFPGGAALPQELLVAERNYSRKLGDLQGAVAHAKYLFSEKKQQDHHQGAKEKWDKALRNRTVCSRGGERGGERDIVHSRRAVQSPVTKLDYVREGLHRRQRPGLTREQRLDRIALIVFAVFEGIIFTPALLLLLASFWGLE